MPQPASQDVHIDQVATDFAINYIQAQQLYIATRVFPIIPVSKQSNKYIVWNRNDWLRDDAQKRADATESVGSGYSYSQDSYFADVWAFHKDVGAQSRHNQDAWMNLDQGAIQFVSRKILLRQEVQWATDFFGTGIWGTDYAVPVVWSDVTSDPIEDIELNIEAMLTTTGFKPNTFVIGYKAFRRLKNHPDIVARLTGLSNARPMTVTPQQIAAIFGFDNVFVCMALKATNVEGETAAYDMIHGKHAWMGFVNPTPANDEPSAGYTFAWDYAGYSPIITVDSFDIRKIKATRYEGESAWDNKVVAADLGVFFPNVIA